MNDIAITNGNETAYVKQATKLGTKTLILITKQHNGLPTPPNHHLQRGLYLHDPTKNQLKKTIQTAQTKKLTTLLQASGDEKLNRFAIEQAPPTIIYGFELLNPKDSLHYRRGGLDQTLCKLLTKRNITVGFSFELILTHKKPALIIGRIIQNIKLCKKYKVPMRFGSFATKPENLRSLHDLKSLVASWEIDGQTLTKLFHS